MPTLVCPAKTVHVIRDERELRSMCQRFGIMKIHSNLRQLCSWDEVGSDRSGRGLAGGWTLLENVKWLACGGVETLFPVCGTAKQIHKTLPGLRVGTTPEHVKKLLNGERKSLEDGRWKCLNPGKSACPAFALSLVDGDSLLGRMGAAGQPSQVDFAIDPITAAHRLPPSLTLPHTAPRGVRLDDRGLDRSAPPSGDCYVRCLRA